MSNARQSQYDRSIESGERDFIESWARAIAADNGITKPLGRADSLAKLALEIFDALNMGRQIRLRSKAAPSRRETYNAAKNAADNSSGVSWTMPHGAVHLRPLLDAPLNGKDVVLDDIRQSLYAALSGASVLGSERLGKNYIKQALDLKSDLVRRVARALRDQPKREDLDGIIRQAMYDIYNNHGVLAGAGQSSDDFDHLNDGAPRRIIPHWKQRASFNGAAGTGPGVRLSRNGLGSPVFLPQDQASVPLADQANRAIGRISGKGYVPARRERHNANMGSGSFGYDLDGRTESYLQLAPEGESDKASAIPGRNAYAPGIQTATSPARRHLRVRIGNEAPSKKPMLFRIHDPATSRLVPPRAATAPGHPSTRIYLDQGSVGDRSDNKPVTFDRNEGKKELVQPETEPFDELQWNILLGRSDFLRSRANQPRRVFHPGRAKRARRVTPVIARFR